MSPKQAKSTESITVSLGSLVASQKALSVLGSQHLRSGKEDFRLSRIIKSVGGELELYEANRQKLLERLAYKPEPQEGGPPIPQDMDWQFETPAKRLEFAKEYGELVKIEVKIAGPKFTIEDFGKSVPTANDLLALEWLIAE
jgi:hypothetical protein